MQPKVFVAENVSGLVKGVAKGYFKNVLSGMRQLNYKVEARLLNSAWLGVPQSRERLFFIGVRNDLGKQPAFPKPLRYYYTLGEIFPYIKQVKKGGTPNNWVRPNLPSPTITQSAASRSLSSYFDGGGWIESETVSASGGSTSAASVTHPTEKRKFSIAELKLVCSFPNDFQLTGTFEKQWERLGRAVPPLMAKAIAETIRDEILC